MHDKNILENNIFATNTVKRFFANVPYFWHISTKVLLFLIVCCIALTIFLLKGWYQYIGFSFIGYAIFHLGSRATAWEYFADGYENGYNDGIRASIINIRNKTDWRIKYSVELLNKEPNFFHAETYTDSNDSAKERDKDWYNEYASQGKKKFS